MRLESLLSTSRRIDDPVTNNAARFKNANNLIIRSQKFKLSRVFVGSNTLDVRNNGPLLDSAYLNCIGSKRHNSIKTTGRNLNA